MQCFSFSDLLHSVWRSEGPPMLVQMAWFHSFYWSGNIPLIHVPLLYPFFCWWTFRLLPCLGYCKQCFSEYWGACAFSNHIFLWYRLRSGIVGSSVQFSSVAQLCLTLCDPMNHSTPGLPVHHQLPEFTQTHVHRWWTSSDAIEPSHPLSSPSPPAPNPSQHQSLFQWVNSLHEVAKVLELQL